MSYPADPDTVFEMLRDPAFQEQKCVDSRAPEHSVEITEEGADTKIVVSRTLSTERMPSYVQSLVGPTMTIVETYRWPTETDHNGREGTIDVTVPGSPVRMKGSVVLSPDAQGSTVLVVADLKAGIPLIGGKIEQAAAPLLTQKMDEEQASAKAWLAG